MQRIQRKRSKGYKTPPSTIYAGRPSVYGNPFIVKKRGKVFDVIYTKKGEVIRTVSTHDTKLEAQRAAVELYKKWFNPEIAEIGSELYKFRQEYDWRGFVFSSAICRIFIYENASCWCKVGDPCHVDWIVELVNCELARR